jgi:UDP-glucose 4-epimerase
MRVLVTGAAGYVGNAVVHGLTAAEHEVVATAHHAEPRVRPGVEVRRGSILDRVDCDALVSGVDAVVHLAAVARVREAASDPLRYYRVNVSGTLNLLEALAAESERRGIAGRLVFASTAAVYGAPVEQPISESTPLAPLNPYPSTKIAAEEMIRWQAATGKLGAVTLRLFNAAGAVEGYADPDLSRIIPKVAAVARGVEPELVINGDGTAVRDFVHVADIATAVALALGACEPGAYDVFNVGATPASVLDIVAAAERLTGREVQVSHRPANPNESPALIADTSRIREELGWRPERSGLDELVRDQLDSLPRS